MHKVMLPVDGSASSENAARYLVGSAREMGALEIHLLNVQALAEGWEVKRFLREDELAGIAREYGEAALASTRAILDAAGLAYTIHIEQGEVAATIVGLTQTLGCDHVVMGCHGRSALEGLFLGSVATKVLHLVNVPVTLIK